MKRRPFMRLKLQHACLDLATLAAAEVCCLLSAHLRHMHKWTGLQATHNHITRRCASTCAWRAASSWPHLACHDTCMDLLPVRLH